MRTTLLTTGTLVASALAVPFAAPVDTGTLFARSLTTQCGTSGPLSCHNTTRQQDSCCFESPGGLLLQTQFWDYNPSTGPADSFTIHGLWPDNCDGTYPQNCDSSREYKNIDQLLTAQGASDTLDYMKTYWKNDPKDGSDESFWEHEWGKHGTCYSTLNPSCLPSGSPKGAEAVAFFETTVGLFKTLPTYDWLGKHGITPSTSKTYTLADIQAALKAEAGVTPQLDCTDDALNMVSWYFNVQGSLIDGKFDRIETITKGSCKATGIKFPPKTGGSSSGGGAGGDGGDGGNNGGGSNGGSNGGGSNDGGNGGGSNDGGSGGDGGDGDGTPSTLPAQAHLLATDGASGGLLGAGTLSTQTPATYTLTGTADAFTLRTSKGACGVSAGGALACGGGVAAGTFSAVGASADGGDADGADGGDGLVLAWQGSSAWTSKAAADGAAALAVYAGSGEATDFELAITAV